MTRGPRWARSHPPRTDRSGNPGERAAAVTALDHGRRSRIADPAKLAGHVEGGVESGLEAGGEIVGRYGALVQHLAEREAVVQTPFGHDRMKFTASLLHASRRIG